MAAALVTNASAPSMFHGGGSSCRVGVTGVSKLGFVINRHDVCAATCVASAKILMLRGHVTECGVRNVTYRTLVGPSIATWTCFSVVKWRCWRCAASAHVAALFETRGHWISYHVHQLHHSQERDGNDSKRPLLVDAEEQTLQTCATGVSGSCVDLHASP